MSTASRSHSQQRPWESNPKMGVGLVCRELAWEMVQFKNKHNPSKLAERDKRAISQAALWAEWKGITDIYEIPWYALPCHDAIKTQEENFNETFKI